MLTDCVMADCTATQCIYVPKAPAGAPCNLSQDQCNAAGQCVDCVDDSGCPAPLKCAADNLCSQ